MSVKRYSAGVDGTDPNGNLVKYTDYTALEQKLAESQREFRAADATIENLQMQLNAEREAKLALAAENAGLKGAFSKPDAWLSWHSIPPTFYEPDRGGEYLQVHEKAGEKNDDGSDSWPVYSKPEIETPATDAFLAEVRAQVWIEGNEPAEFGRYWVRYETDVGPQYCSAQWMEYNFCAGTYTNIHKIWLADHSRSINSLRGVTHYTKLPDSLEGTAQLRKGVQS